MAAVGIMNGQLVSVGACCECGVEFAMPDYLKQARLVDHKSFFCPLGHSQHYPAGKSELQQLRERVADLAAARDAANQQRMAAQAETERLRKAAKKAAKRTAAGVCPCCNRTVSQMARHIKTKHPEYVAK